MTCAACVRRIEKGLQDLEGVKSASVNFATEKAMVEYDPSIINTDVMIKKVKDIGYEAVGEQKSEERTIEKTTISVGGMTCAACVRRVESALKSESS
jgi:Cu+-exporting ATPase